MQIGDYEETDEIIPDKEPVPKKDEGYERPNVPPQQKEEVDELWAS